jgi:hypothetical protein
VTEKAKGHKPAERDLRGLTDSESGPLCGSVRLLPRFGSSTFHGGRLRDGRTWREGIFSFKY